ncbi:hypothetical protein [Streptodolium elevatio]|uniref:Uncharacterized protein n=1 Tax=Streptodolium elevatio TaxID=3157996 RepID=A0ABV3DWB6_9ACTN
MATFDREMVEICPQRLRQPTGRGGVLATKSPVVDNITDLTQGPGLTHGP